MMVRLSSINFMIVVSTGFLMASMIFPASARSHSTEVILHYFQGGGDGTEPSSGLAMDSSQNLYGTTYGGGDPECKSNFKFCGTVYRVTPDGTETVLHAFTGGADGFNPDGTLALDAEGNLYGTTEFGGSGSGTGTVFKLAPDGSKTVLYSFNGGTDGSQPGAGVILDAVGNLYGTTQIGGNNGCGNGGCGTVFKITANGTETVLHSFQGPDGIFPFGGLVFDSQDDMYGTTWSGGNNSCSCGVVFKIDSTGVESTVYAFQGSSVGDGAKPARGDLILDSQGNLYGTTYFGGTSGCSSGCGTIFRIAPDGAETVLYSFQGGTTDGSQPEGTMVMDSSGNLFGTTQWGGNSIYGTVFELTPDQGESTLLNFRSGKKTGANPIDGVIEDQEGNLYGTTTEGGYKKNGVVFKFTQ
jgi:uncharacterized repeat protein (TIGR03803 family)